MARLTRYFVFANLTSLRRLRTRHLDLPCAQSLVISLFMSEKFRFQRLLHPGTGYHQYLATEDRSKGSWI